MGDAGVAGEAWVVNRQLDDEASCTRPEDNPFCWDLGLNLHLPDPGMESAGWFADVEAIARFLGSLRAEFVRFRHRHWRRRNWNCSVLD
jgi:hypothetical protein